MNISIQTKYNLKDKVYYIQEKPKYNDYYSNETIWDISRLYDRNTQPKQYTIDKIAITTYDEDLEILYLVDNKWFSEDMLFLNQDDALNKCKELNKL